MPNSCTAVERIIRPWRDEDINRLWSLTWHTVHLVNCRDYTPAQLDAWAPSEPDPNWWEKLIRDHNPWVVEDTATQTLLAWGDVQPSGLIHCFFCDYRYQRQGIGRLLLNHLLCLAHQQSLRRVFVEASETARPFFLAQGFQVVHPIQAELRGQQFAIWLMEKFI